ncbi:hypothetical protein DFP72DRAFT_412700 [Ephemerocybe angulata]|uniref:Uncharacterized protein n=1 Tax=Ephemerocybe angulata TaxID=980116 RepID=A0A8H6MGR0_9AGAR|nr:hypothetical protein DFP72DRAFT_412700 [Tulosesus angulatus]
MGSTSLFSANLINHFSPSHDPSSVDLHRRDTAPDVIAPALLNSNHIFTLTGTSDISELAHDYYPSTTPNLGTNEGDVRIASVSTSFYPGWQSSGSDLVISSSDRVLFYFTSSTINQVSSAIVPSILRFSVVPGGGIEKAGIIPVPTSAAVLNIVFHTIYGTSCAQNFPSTDDLVRAVDALPNLGVRAGALVRPDTPTFSVLQSHAPVRPMDIYALAAHHDIVELAIASSTHLLSFPLYKIGDELSVRIGATYLKRLFHLHMRWKDSVKYLLQKIPPLHSPRRSCGFEDQEKVARMWALGTTLIIGELDWSEISPRGIKNVYEPLSDNLPCSDCQEMLKKRIQEVVTELVAIKTMIEV